MKCYLKMTLFCLLPKFGVKRNHSLIRDGLNCWDGSAKLCLWRWKFLVQVPSWHSPIFLLAVYSLNINALIKIDNSYQALPLVISCGLIVLWNDVVVQFSYMSLYHSTSKYKQRHVQIQVHFTIATVTTATLSCHGDITIENELSSVCIWEKLDFLVASWLLRPLPSSTLAAQTA